MKKEHEQSIAATIGDPIEACEAVRARLMAESEPSYADFSAKLIPNIPWESILGVRLPKLRALAKELLRMPEAESFLNALPHEYLEENTLHALMLNAEKSLEKAVPLLRAFLPHVDNWATCDALRPAAFKKRFPDALPFIYECIESEHPYTIRFGIEMLMCFGLGEHFSEDFHSITADVQSDDYYVNMMRSWYFATALAARYDETLPYISENRLDVWTHNKSIRKAIESFRISEEQKAFLKTLKRAKSEKAKKTEKVENGERAETAEKSVLPVSAAVIRRGEEVLICKRAANKARGGKWEFPGGKLEAGETAEQALIRECREELGVTLKITRRLTELTHIYPDLTVRLFVFECTVQTGEPQPIEHEELAFVSPKELFKYDICDADREIAETVFSE